MAQSLAATLQQNKPLMRDQQGQLVETTQEEVQSLAQKAGMAAPPTTPLGVGMIGGNAHQQKMAGTPAQKQAALQISQDLSQSLQDVMRRQQARSQATTQEQAAIQKSANLQNLGGLGDRVNDLINSQKVKLASKQAQLQATDTPQLNQDEVPIEQIPRVKELLGILAVTPGNMEAQMELNTLLGRDPNKTLSADELQSLYQDTTSSIAQSGAQAISDNITAGDLIEQGGFGYTVEQLSDLLGVPVDKVGALTVSQIHDRVNQAVADEFSQSAEVGQQAQSLQVGAAERGLARQAGREASATGIRSVEAEMSRLNDQIAQANIISIGGKQMPLEEALSDDNISGLISNYLAAAPGSPLRTQLEQTEPDLVKFIRDNQVALEKASADIGKGAEQFQQIQISNRAAVSEVVPEGLLTTLVPSLKSLATAHIDPKSVPILVAASGLTPEQKIAFKDGLTQLSSIPNAAAELSGLTAEDIKALDFANPNGLGRQYIEQKRALNAEQAEITQAGDDPDAIIRAITGDQSSSASEFQHQYDSQQWAADLGLPNSGNKYTSYDSDGDGRVDWNQIAASAKSEAGQSYSLSDAVSGKKPANNFPMKVPEAPTFSNDQNKLYSALSGPVKDGKLNYQEMMSTKLDFDQLSQIDSRVPSLGEQQGGFVRALADKSWSDISKTHKLGTTAGYTAALQDLDSKYTQTVGKLEKEGYKPQDARNAANEYFNKTMTRIYKTYIDAGGWKNKSGNTNKKADVDTRNTGPAPAPPKPFGGKSAKSAAQNPGSTNTDSSSQWEDATKILSGGGTVVAGQAAKKLGI